MLTNYRDFSQTRFKQSLFMQRKSLSLPKNNTQPTLFRKGRGSWMENFEKNDEPQGSSVKEVIDEYFKEDFNLKMPMILQKQPSKEKKSRRMQHRKPKAFNQNDELSKSIAYPLLKDTQKENQSFPPSAPALKWSVSQKNKELPSIHEQTQGPQERLQQVLNLTSRTEFLRKTSSMVSSYTNPEGEQYKRKTFENQLFTIYLIIREGKAVERVKEFKQQGAMVMQRELKMRQYLPYTFWRQSKYNPYSFSAPLTQPIKDSILRIIPDETTPGQLKIKAKPFHAQLLANNCQQASALLRNLCLQLLNFQGKVLNNKINPSNLFIFSEGIRIAEWGYSSFRQQYDIRQNHFQKRLYGVLKGQRQWFASPEYLAPEIIRQLLGHQQQDIWKGESSSDVWSLGVTFFEIITLIPVWSDSKCSLVHRPSVVRNGVLYSANRELSNLIKKQSGLQKTTKRLLNSQLSPCQQSPKLFDVILRMLQFDPIRRISLRQAISLL